MNTLSFYKFKKKMLVAISNQTVWFSTTQNLYLPDDKLPENVKEDIHRTIYDEYTNNIPKFKKPTTDDVVFDLPADSAQESMNKYMTFCAKHDRKASNIAEEQASKLSERVKKEIEEKYPEHSSESLRNRVDKEVQFKMFSDEKQAYVLPGQAQWYKGFEESRTVQAAAEEGFNRARSIESNDSFMGEGEARYRSEDFRSQSIAGSPGCHAGAGPSNTWETSGGSEDSQNSESENNEQNGSENSQGTQSENNEQNGSEKSQGTESENNEQNGSENSDDREHDENHKNENNKRPLSSDSDDNPTKKWDGKQSPLDYVLEKQATEMPDIQDADGGD